MPVLHQLRGNMNQVQVVWDEPARENGARVDQYWLEGRTDQTVREKRDTNLTAVDALAGDQDWLLYYNGSSKSPVVIIPFLFLTF